MKAETSPEFVAIIGSRDWPRSRRDLIHQVILSLDKYRVVIVSGGARGVDVEAAEFAKMRGFTVIEFPVAVSRHETGLSRADYARAFKARNAAVAELADRAIAFTTDALTPGTQDTLDRMRRAGKPVKRYLPDSRFDQESVEDLIARITSSVKKGVKP